MRNWFGGVGIAARILVLLLAAAALWVLLRGPALEERSGSPAEVAGRSPLPGSVAYPTAGAGTSGLRRPERRSGAALAVSTPPTPASEKNVPNPAADGGALETVGPDSPARSPVYTSRFAGRAGYHPPDDPESLSVLTGRRDAPPVDLELSGGGSSLEDLARRLLAALRDRDERALHELRLSQREFAEICWPEFPESRPVTGVAVDDAWGMLLPQSLAGVSLAVGSYGGRELQLLRVETGGPFQYRNFVRHRGVLLVTRDASSGEEHRLRFVPSVIERHGRFKALTYRDRG